MQVASRDFEFLGIFRAFSSFRFLGFRRREHLVAL
jgi:hypothetical protein